jgi:hypothetical protein
VSVDTAVKLLAFGRPVARELLKVILILHLN